MPNNTTTHKPAATVDWKHALLHLVDAKSLSTPRRFNQLHALFLTTGLSHHSLPFRRLLLLSTSTFGGGVTAISLLLNSPLPPSPFLSNTLISSLANSGRHFLALSLLPTIHPSPNSHSYPSLLKSFSSTPDLRPIALSLHSHILKTLPFPLDPFVVTSLLILHSRHRRNLSSCRHLFDQIPRPDLPAWNAILSSSNPLQVLSLFQSLQNSGHDFRPNEITILHLIIACGDMGDFGHGVWAHAYIVRSDGRVLVNRFVGAALVEMYGKCGRLDLARQVFDELRERDGFCYNALMRGFAAVGDGRGALDLLGEIGRLGDVRADGVTFLMVMMACGHAGMAEEGRRCFERMEGEFGVKPGLEHYGCLVDVLGRCGRVEEAEEVVRRMPMAPNGMVLRSLLGACKRFGRGCIDEGVVCKLMELDPDHGGNYVLLSNICADFGRWDGAVVWRKEMRDRGIGKRAGLSSVEIDGVVEEFCIGDQTHPKVKEIYEMVHQISRRFHE